MRVDGEGGATTLTGDPEIVELLRPHVPGTREAVEKDHEAAAAGARLRALLRDVQLDAVDVVRHVGAVPVVGARVVGVARLGRQHADQRAQAGAPGDALEVLPRRLPREGRSRERHMGGAPCRRYSVSPLSSAIIFKIG